MPRYKLDYHKETRVRFNPCSGNKKVGTIPVSLTTGNTCPPSCPWWGNGCYSENTHVATSWGRLHAGNGISWNAFCDEVARLPKGQLWRHNEAGDLPGEGEDLDVQSLMRLVEANSGKRGFTYTHKRLLTFSEMAAVREANARGFTISLSADGFEEADAMWERSIGPVVMVLPKDHPKRTPRGRRIVVCPAQSKGVSCASCGICARKDRSFVVGFHVHGLRPRQVEIFAARFGQSVPMYPSEDLRLSRWSI